MPVFGDKAFKKVIKLKQDHESGPWYNLTDDLKIGAIQAHRDTPEVRCAQRKCHVRAQDEADICKPRRESSEETKLVDILIFELWPLVLRNKFLLLRQLRQTNNKHMLSCGKGQHVTKWKKDSAGVYRMFLAGSKLIRSILAETPMTAKSRLTAWALNPIFTCLLDVCTWILNRYLKLELFLFPFLLQLKLHSALSLSRKSTIFCLHINAEMWELF